MTLHPPPGVPGPGDRWSLYLDVDGTLLEIANRPDAVHVPTALRALLAELRLHLDGALALVSGRSIRDLDQLFAPLRLPAVGLHGLETRSADSNILRPALPHAWRSLSARLRDFTRRHPGTLLEDKGAALALHFRESPEDQEAVEAELTDALTRLGPPATLQAGKQVLEIRWGGRTKGDGISGLARHVPFQGRFPVFVGDDDTDQAGFSAVNALGGMSVYVGSREPGAARYKLADVPAVHEWLDRVARSTGTHPSSHGP